MIPKDIIDHIHSVARIDEVVGDYIPLKRRGASLWGLCPFPGHTEKTPSFSVNIARNYCKCFGCGKGANPVGFVMEMEQCSYPEALRKLADKYHIEIPEREMTDEEKEHHTKRDSMFILNEWANKWYQEQLWNTPEGQAIGLSYFHERGLRDETIRHFQLGYSPSKGYMLPTAAKKAGYSEEFLVCNPDTGVGTGLCARSVGNGNDDRPRIYDRYNGRVIFPIHTRSGKTVGFAGRLLEKRDGVGKYVNSPESMIYSKKNELYGLALARKAIVNKQKCYLVEGQMDCISMSQAGIENVVCSGGTALTTQQIMLIRQYTENVTILYDGDAAGVHAALRGIDMFLEKGLNVKVMLFPDGDDPDSFARKHTAEEFVQYIAQHEEDFIRYKTRTEMAAAGDDPNLQSKAVRSILTSISLLEDRIMRERYIKDCAQKVEMAEDTILQEVAKMRRDRKQEEKDAEIKAAKRAEQEEKQIVVPKKEQPVSSKFPHFQNIVRMLIKYGEKPMIFQNPDGSQTQIRIGDYIQQYLQATQIAIPDPLLERFFEEYNAHKDDPAFEAASYFVNHSDITLSNMAIELISEKYATTEETEEEMSPLILLNLVMHILYELHFAMVEVKLKEVLALVDKASQTNDDELLITAMTQQRQLNELKQTIAGLLGKC